MKRVVALSVVLLVGWFFLGVIATGFWQHNNGVERALWWAMTAFSFTLYRAVQTVLNIVGVGSGSWQRIFDTYHAAVYPPNTPPPGQGPIIAPVGWEPRITGSYLALLFWPLLLINLLALGLRLAFGREAAATPMAPRQGGMGVGRAVPVTILLLALLVMLRGNISHWLGSQQTQSIQHRLDQTEEAWVPSQLNASCAVVTGFNAQVLATQGQDARICGATVLNRLQADVATGLDPNDQTVSQGLAFLGQLSELAKQGQIDGVSPDDSEFASFGAYASSGYQAAREGAWQQAAQKYLGMLTGSNLPQDLRAEAALNLDILAERLWDSGDAKSQDVARRIAVTTRQQLHCQPTVLRGNSGDASLPSCQQAANRMGQSGGVPWGSMLIVVAVLVLLGELGMFAWRRRLRVVLS